MKIIYTAILCVLTSILSSAIPQNSISFFSGMTQYNYHESAPSNESGILPNLGVAMTYNLSDNFQLNGYFDYQAANLTYTGKTWGGAPLNLTAYHIFYDGNVTLGYNLGSMISGLNQTYIYAGYGQYLWIRDDLANETPSKGDYSEDYSWGYIPIGITAPIYQNSKFKLSWNAEYQILTNPKVIAYLSQTGNGWGDVTLNLGNSYGALLGANVSYYVTSQWFLYLKPSYQYIYLAKSSPTTVPNSTIKVYEPSSSTNIWSCLIGIGYNF